MREQISGWSAELFDRLLASDPGLGRLRSASSAAFAMGSALAIEYGVAKLLNADAKGTIVAMLVGAITAMMGSMPLSGTGARRKAWTAAFFPVALGLGMGAGVAVGDNTDLMLVVFVIVMFIAVFVRRFGLAFFFYGFMMWIGYFFASFLHATLESLPTLILAVVVATVWVLFLSVTVFATNPGRTLRRTMRAYDARARSVARTCTELLETPLGDVRRLRRWRKRLGVRQSALAETALMVEGWSEESGSLPEGWSGIALRRRMIDFHHTMDRIAFASAELSGKDARLVRAAIKVVEPIARRQDALAHLAAQHLATLASEGEARETSGWWSARRLAVAALEFIDLSSTSERPPESEIEESESGEEYEPTASLFIGNLPGAPAVAREVPARGTAWNPLSRLDMTTRQAIQVAIAGAIAIVVGRELSPTRYYWAVIAAFVVFNGTGTRSETFVKAFNRVLGTLLGLFASIFIAQLTAGHNIAILAVIVGSIFFGLYLIRVSYAYMIFFITIMVGQLYTVLSEFSDALLVLRLEETMIGAAIGVAVALIVTPLSTRDTVRSARDGLLVALSEFLTGVAEHVEGKVPNSRLDAMSRVLDNHGRQLALVAKPLTRPLVWGNSSRKTRHQLSLYMAALSLARALAVGLRRRWPEDPENVAVVCHALAEVVDGLVGVAPGHPMPTLSGPLGVADEALFEGSPGSAGARATDPVLRPLIHLHALLSELVEMPAGRDRTPA